MKTKTLVFGVVFIDIALIAAGCLATDEELCGAWVNPEYKGNTPPFGKEVYSSDGTWKEFRRGTSAWEKDVKILEGGWIKADAGTYKIEDKWTDPEGNIWYKVIAFLGSEDKTSFATEKWYMLMKITDSNNTLEYIFSTIDYPKRIDPNDVQVRYRILYREE